MVYVNEALADGSVHDFKIEVAHLASAPMMFYAFLSSFSVSLIPIDQNGSGHAFDVLLIFIDLLSKGNEAGLGDDFEVVVLQNAEALGFQTPLEIVGAIRIAGNVRCCDAYYCLRRMAASLAKRTSYLPSNRQNGEGTFASVIPDCLLQIKRASV